ncbi:MAG TPA: sugar ABC transporter permease [Nitrososphaerales archaeon]|nr:sugar ABC transporter permease [Nitrososphaerales archaeon]
MKGLVYLVFLPLLLVLGAVELYPFAVTIYLSVTDYNTGAFVGASGYLSALQDPQLGSAVLHSFVFALVGTSLTFLLGISFAFLLTQKFKGRAMVEVILLLPLAAAPLIAGVVWSPSAVWDDLNTFAHFILGLPYINLTNYLVFYPVMSLSFAWEWAPMMMLVALSIVRSVPQSVYEAAEASGASAWKVFRRVALPTVTRSPVTSFVLLINFIDALKTFEIPFTWSTWLSYPGAGSPVDTLSLLLFKLLVVPTYGFPISYISSVATLLFLLTFASSSLLILFMRRAGRT